MTLAKAWHVVKVINATLTRIVHIHFESINSIIIQIYEELMKEHKLLNIWTHDSFVFWRKKWIH